MTEIEVFLLSEKALLRAIKQVKENQWEMRLPDWFQLASSQDRSQLTLKDIVNYHAYDTAWIPDVLTGKTIEQVGHKYDGDLVKGDPAEAYHKLSLTAANVVHKLEPSQLDTPVHLTYGDFPIREYLKHITIFRAFRAYDIAKLIGADTKLPPELVQGLWSQLLPDAEDWRAMGVFGPKVQVGEDADLQTKLLALAGRSV